MAFLTSRKLQIGVLVALIVILAGTGFLADRLGTRVVVQTAIDASTQDVPATVQGLYWHEVGTADVSTLSAEEQTTRFANFAEEERIIGRISAMSLYDATGTVIWTDIKGRTVGQKEENEDVRRALGGEQFINDIVVGGKSNDALDNSLLESLGSKRLAELYVPIKDQFDNTVAAAEVYFDETPTLAIASRLQLVTTVGIIGVLLLLLPILFLTFAYFNRELRRRTANFEALYTRAPLGIYTVTPDGKVASMNPRMAEISGVADPKTLIGSNVLTLDSYKKAGLVPYIEKGLAGEGFYLPEVEYTSHFGKKTTFRRYMGVPLLGSGKQDVDGLLVIVEDVSEERDLRRRLEDLANSLDQKVQEKVGALADSEERYRQLFESAGEAIMYGDYEKGIVDCNEATVRMFGYKDKKDILGKEPFMLSPETQPDGNSSKEQSARLIADAFKYGKKFFGWTHQRADGSTFPASVLMTTMKLGGKDMLQAVVRDLTEERKMEESVQESRQQLQRIIDNSDDVFYSAGPDGTLTYISPQVSRYGYSVADMVGRPLLDFVSDADKEQARSDFEYQMSGLGQVPDRTMRLRRADGTDVLAEVRTRPVKGADRKIIGTSGTLRDITERVRAKAAREKSEQRFRDFFRKAPYYAHIVDAADGRFIDVNDAWTDAFGYDRQEMLGMTIFDKALYAGGNAPTKERIWSRIHEQGGVIRDMSLALRTKGGQARNVVLNMLPLDVQGGTITTLLSVFRDVTDERKVAKSLEETETLYKELSDAAPQCIKLWDTAGKLITLNRAGMEEHGIADMEAAKKYDFFASFTDEDAEKARGAFKYAMDGKPVTLRLRHKPGMTTRAVCLESFVPIKDPDGKVSGVFGLSSDLTEIESMEHRVSELDRLKSRFITALTHVTRTPLNKIRWGIETVLGGELGAVSDQQRDFLTEALDNEESVLAILTNMNYVLDIERGTMSYDKAQMSLNSLVASVVKEMEKSANAAGVTLMLKGVKGKLSVEADNEKLRRSLGALVDNAIRYSKGEKRVTIECHGLKGRARCTIKDTGIGIPEAEQPFIFERFYRASNAQIVYPNGVGLGLYITKSVVEAHGGNVGFKSSEGEGSTFWFDIPLSGEAA